MVPEQQAAAHVLFHFDPRRAADLSVMRSPIFGYAVAAARRTGVPITHSNFFAMGMCEMRRVESAPYVPYSASSAVLREDEDSDSEAPLIF